MRIHRLFLYSKTESNSNNPACSIDGRQSSSPACNTSSRNLLNSGSKYEFSWCTWNSCSASGYAGGALKFTGTSTKVYVEFCSFTSCSADREGGAIHTSSINTLDVKESLFYKCSSSTEENDHGSGAIWIYDIKQKLSVSQNVFISCTSKASGGASLIQECEENINGADVINSCRYIDCNATNETPDGGAVWIRLNKAFLGLKNCLFSLCNSGFVGGALRHNLDVYSLGCYPIRYCFFNKNTSPSGNDIFFPSLPSDAPCLHCLSTTSRNRIGYYSDSVASNVDLNWLPLTVIYLEVSDPVQNHSSVIAYKNTVPVVSRECLVRKGISVII